MQGAVRQALTLTAVSGLLFFTALGGAELWDEDEPTFAGAAREMLARGEWVVPYFNGQMLPDKPALSYWVMMVGYKLLGPTEFAARAGSALFGIGTVLLTWRLGCRLFSPRAGFWAGVALATCISFDVVARAATPDAVLTFFCTLAIVCFVESLELGGQDADGRERGRLRYDGGLRRLPLAGGYAAIGMAVLAKGPIGLLLPAATVGLFLLLALETEEEPSGKNDSGWLPALWRMWRGVVRRLQPRNVVAVTCRVRPWMGLAILLAIAGPWYLAVGLRTDGAWLAGFLGKHNFQRFLQPLEHHRGPFFYYLVAVMIGLFPWSLLLGPTILFVKSRLRQKGAHRLPLYLLLSWVGVYLAFFSLAATKLPNYVVPMYPALAILVGAWLDAWIAEEASFPALMSQTAWATLALAGLAVSIALPVVAGHLLGSGMHLTVIGLPFMIGGALCWWWHRCSKPTHTLAAFAASAAAFGLLIFAYGAVEVGRYQNGRLIADAIRERASGDDLVVRTYGYWRPSLIYYLGHHVGQIFEDEQAKRFCENWPDDGFLVTTADRLDRIADLLPRDVVVLARTRWFLRPAELLLLGRGEIADTRMGAVRWSKSSHQ